eukprot:CAMPEP_0206495900 /NCGR_PEP_ID=MMETSP0324_2-20121206/48964_1 /ASSEMBLY_ACC=CAM_ASM_000836 /TAXON_ID=2866 /ORGANISM="Crypthecodinium cohnii, Strain Seligo" /LENGTH=57 /DNA_ID=CAMNT_0053980565 /DNA_START=387 /DNA_END=560 /DNA_ORIENTATION=-
MQASGAENDDDSYPSEIPEANQTDTSLQDAFEPSKDQPMVWAGRALKSEGVAVGAVF